MYPWKKEKKERFVGCPVEIKFLGGREKWKGQVMASGLEPGEGNEGP